MKRKKSTEDLEKILGSTHRADVKNFLEEEKEELLEGDRPFYHYFKGLCREKKVKLQEVFLLADISEGYGYKLVSEEKRTRQRDVIYRLCYGAGFTVEETQKALARYGLPKLYARITRDALMMVCLNERPGDITEVNTFLKQNGAEELASCGMQED